MYRGLVPAEPPILTSPAKVAFCELSIVSAVLVALSSMPVDVNVVTVAATGVVPPITALSIVPEFISMPVTGVVPSSRLSMSSKLSLILVPQVSSDAPTSGLVKP